MRFDRRSATISGASSESIQLAEHARRRADATVQYVDDSDGWLNVISGRVGELHLRACRDARPDPVELEGSLAGLELFSELDTESCGRAFATDTRGSHVGVRRR